MELRALPAFSDNYIWMVDHHGHALVVDPGDHAPVLQVLKNEGLQLDAIVVTHHHTDHTGGISALREATGCTVLGPALENIPEPFVRMGEGDTWNWQGLSWQILDVPGHTAGHIAWYSPNFTDQPLLFCGDTLFSGGCGRLFEGTPAQMLDSLERLARLPANTLVCCTHEYTLSNLRFALAVEPDNTVLQQHLSQCQIWRSEGRMTLPSHIGLELQINPFLRTSHAAVQAVARLRDPLAIQPQEVFAALRAWKNVF